MQMTKANQRYNGGHRMWARQKDYTAGKLLISAIVGILVFIGVFAIDRLGINWAVGHLQVSHNAEILIKIVMWLFAIAWTFGLAIFLGFIIGGLVAIVLGVK